KTGSHFSGSTLADHVAGGGAGGGLQLLESDQRPGADPLEAAGIDGSPTGGLTAAHRATG
ncbi:MAG: hypothetical protein ABL907_24120, partial [Hyphomicrobium sp.]